MSQAHVCATDEPRPLIVGWSRYRYYTSSENRPVTRQLWKVRKFLTVEALQASAGDRTAGRGKMKWVVLLV